MDARRGDLAVGGSDVLALSTRSAPGRPGAPWCVPDLVRSVSSLRSGRMSSMSGVSPFPPIAEYAFLANCHTGALVGQDGAVDWLCVPSFDSPSVFGTLLD